MIPQLGEQGWNHSEASAQKRNIEKKKLLVGIGHSNVASLFTGPSHILRGDAKQTVDEKIKLSKTFGSNWRLKCRELMS